MMHTAENEYAIECAVTMQKCTKMHLSRLIADSDQSEPPGSLSRSPCMDLLQPRRCSVECPSMASSPSIFATTARFR